MIRLVFLLLFLLALHPAHAEPQAALLASADDFNQTLAAEVFTTALVFMAPRTLDPVPIPQMALWSLRGITALDPTLTPGIAGDQLVLTASGGRPLLTIAAPGPADPPGWGQAAAQFARAAWDASPALRRAGTQGVIRNMFDELFNHLDPYSRYAGPEEAETDRDHRSGTAGTGITAVLRGGVATITSVAEASPADDAGIEPGEMILAIDGVRPGRRDIATMLAGEPDTDVTLTLRHSGSTRTVTVTRALVPPETVTAERSGTALVIHISAFNRTTDLHARHVLQAAMGAPAKPTGIVLDLRGNRGGLLRQAVATAELMLGHGLVATTVGRDPEADHVFQANGDDLTGGLPVVVVVDGRSASAAEIVTAALADDGRAVVIGSSTLGKGLVQTIAPLPDGGELFVTWSRVLAPLGWPIQGLGVLPQLCTSLGENTVAAELADLAAGVQPLGRALLRHRTARAPMAVAQILDIRNACPAAIGRDSDLSTARFLLDHPGSYGAALLRRGVGK